MHIIGITLVRKSTEKNVRIFFISGVRFWHLWHDGARKACQLQLLLRALCLCLHALSQILLYCACAPNRNMFSLVLLVSI